MVNQLNAFVSTVNNLTGESTSKELVEFCKKWLDEAADKISAADIDRGFSQLQLPKHTLGYICLFLARLPKLKLENDYIEYVTRVNDAIFSYNDTQIAWAPEIYCRLFQNIADVLISKGLALHGITLLRDAILKFTRHSTEHLTNIHASLFCLCLKSRHFTEALPFFQLNVIDLFKSGTSLNSSENAGKSSASNALDSGEDKFPAPCQKTVLDAKPMLLFFYYGGMILCALEKYEDALLFLEHGICLPAVRLSAIVLEAFKKYILISLILGRTKPVAQLPSYKSSLIQRCAVPLSTRYMNLSSLVERVSNERGDVAAAIGNFLNEHRNVFEKDRNVGLVKQLIIRTKENAIKRLGNVFISLHLNEVSRFSFIMNINETEVIARRICHRDKYPLQYDQKTQTFRFDTTTDSEDSEQKDQSSVCQQQVENALCEMIKLSKLIKNFDDVVRVNPTYVSKNRAMSSGMFPEDEGFHATGGFSSSPPHS
ncbi:COP9 signalosome complex subunit 3 [Ditylenchus destructor]|nr:COP9 signalosome complex subunit 3 [Ditylenchus destructor]